MHRVHKVVQPRRLSRCCVIISICLGGGRGLRSRVYCVGITIEKSRDGDLAKLVKT